MGYTGGKPIIKDYVHVFRPPKAIPAVPRYEIEPGRQAQMDWGICQYLGTDGEFHKVPRCDPKSLERCILNAFEYFGGVPDVVLTDNMKTVVLKHEAGKGGPAARSYSVFVGQTMNDSRQTTKSKKAATRR